jgi:hypothetical protein
VKLAIHVLDSGSSFTSLLFSFLLVIFFYSSLFIFFALVFYCIFLFFLFDFSIVLRFFLLFHLFVSVFHFLLISSLVYPNFLETEKTGFAVIA